MNLLNLMVYGPVCGAQKRKQDVWHALTTEEFIRAGCGERMPTAPCGAKHLRFVTNEAHDTVMLWPPRKQVGPYTRCPECWVATGKKRPRKPKDTR